MLNFKDVNIDELVTQYRKELTQYQLRSTLIEARKFVMYYFRSKGQRLTPQAMNEVTIAVHNAIVNNV